MQNSILKRVVRSVSDYQKKQKKKHELAMITRRYPSKTICFWFYVFFLEFYLTKLEIAFYKSNESTCFYTFIHTSPDRDSPRNPSNSAEQLLFLLKVLKEACVRGAFAQTKLVCKSVVCTFFSLEITEKERACAVAGGAVASQRL